jgi:hypothetical protein
MKKPVKLILFLTAILFSVSNVNAAKLWDNGDTDGSTLGWGQYSSTLDDFYVPGGGWWINRVETIGIYANPTTVTEVEIAIWPHNLNTSSPDGDSVTVLNVTSFTATPTGRLFSGREELLITANFDSAFLKGQNYYWVEVTVSDESGIQDFRFLARNRISHQPAWLHFGQGSINSSLDFYRGGRDLSFALFGNAVQSKFDQVVDDIVLKTREKSEDGTARSFSVVNGLGGNCPAGTTLSPFEMPIYDDDKGYFVVGYETVWFCLPNDLEPEG